jgi:hypothetical protein
MVVPAMPTSQPPEGHGRRRTGLRRRGQSVRRGTTSAEQPTTQRDRNPDGTGFLGRAAAKLFAAGLARETLTAVSPVSRKARRGGMRRPAPAEGRPMKILELTARTRSTVRLDSACRSAPRMSGVGWEGCAAVRTRS